MPEGRVNSLLFNVIGLLFLFTETKELCEAKAKLEKCSNFQIYPWGGKSDPPFKTTRAQNELFTFQCDQWEPIQNSQLIRIYKEIPVHIYTYRYQRQTPIPDLRCSTQIGCYWHLVVKNGNFTLLLTPSGQEWQFHISTDILWSTMAISLFYWHLVVKNGYFTFILTSSGQEWQFHIYTDI